ncbi:MAG: type IV pilus modification protein PilV [Proteobacteria bacterium]|nr:type IV pilus modification protein PilV [Pseudomonadota bacterium]MBU1716395.1 type IV pilus modification protein PilV [Pseudomonadota bacterium]
MGNFLSKNDNGFTLIEVMIAVLVLTMGLLGAAAMQTTAVNGNASAMKLTQATLLANDRVEILMSWPYELPKSNVSILDRKKYPLYDIDNPEMLSELTDAINALGLAKVEYQKIDHDAVGLMIITGVPAQADAFAVVGEYSIYWDISYNFLPPPLPPGPGLPAPPPPDPPIEIGRTIRVDVVWTENNRLKTVTVNQAMAKKSS